ncbi:MAG: helix-turn-helix transcriptional regulator [Candidatus Limiplasma sp.]|nr:helix-turn-helix transcriptional regulator [Candidatus Limiplasma sp.]
MCQWHRNIQRMIDEIDACIRREDGDAATLARLSGKLGYSESYVSRKFRSITGMRLREYLLGRRLAFALRDLRDSSEGILNIALKYGYSSSEAFARAFKEAYGVSPSEYRLNPVPVALHTVLRPLDCYLLDAEKTGTDGEVKTYFVTIPAHKFLHIRNYESVGYWDFWQKQSQIPGQDCKTICDLLDGIPQKLDDLGGQGTDSGSGQVMAFINEPEGRICSWGIPLAEAYGVRLPTDYAGPVPPQMQLMDVAEGTYLVFEHGPFDFKTENALVEERIERAMKMFDYAQTGYRLDVTPDRVFYFYHDCKRYWKYVRPVTR